jgi:hypothetical protein
MLSKLRSHHQIGGSPPTSDLVGILSSHPFPIRSVLRIFGRGIQLLTTSLACDGIPMNLQHAPRREAECLRILKSSPVDYVRNARLNPESESISADTHFFIDHSVPRQARQLTEDMMHCRWYFGLLPEGSEYICVLQCPFDKNRLEELFSKTIPVENRRERTSAVDSIANADFVQRRDHTDKETTLESCVGPGHFCEAWD